MEPKRLECPTFELVSNPTIQASEMIKAMRAMRARESGCLVVWDDGEENPCRGDHHSG